jgi:hypothetical protein
MPELFSRNWPRKQLLERLGDISQIASVSEEELASGPGRGMRQLSFRTGSGLSFTVLPDRGMDLAGADYRGVPLAWRSPAGWVAPSYYEPRGTGWLRSFGGGLMVTCGLTQVGSPAIDDGEELGQHGRISNTPAADVAVGAGWVGDDYVLKASGSVREMSVYGHDLELRRTIETSLAAASVRIRDEIENRGTGIAPLMLLYHFNLGFPLVSEGASLLLPPCRSEARDPGTPLDGLRVIDAPKAGVGEQVFYHEPAHDSDEVCVALVNDHVLAGTVLAFYLRYERSALPYLVQWKHQGAGINALGLEPANCHVEGRPAERERGTLKHLQPGEVVTTSIEWGVVEGSAQVERLRELVATERR